MPKHSSPSLLFSSRRRYKYLLELQCVEILLTKERFTSESKMGMIFDQARWFWRVGRR